MPAHAVKKVRTSVRRSAGLFEIAVDTLRFLL